MSIFVSLDFNHHNLLLLEFDSLVTSGGFLTWSNGQIRDFVRAQGYAGRGQTIKCQTPAQSLCFFGEMRLDVSRHFKDQAVSQA